MQSPDNHISLTEPLMKHIQFCEYVSWLGKGKQAFFFLKSGL